ncbi:unnamed protein product [Cunninghamella blakesleeana]
MRSNSSSILTPKFSKKKNKNKSDGLDKNQLISPKRRKVRDSKDKEELHKLFDKINSEPLYENGTPTQKIIEPEKPTQSKVSKDQYIFLTDHYLDWLYDYQSNDEGGEEENEYNNNDQMQDKDKPDFDLNTLTSKYLEKEQAEGLKMALKNTDSNELKYQKLHFFSKHCKLPNPVFVPEQFDLLNKPNQEKQRRLIKYSESTQLRKCIISSNSICLWYQQGWECPFAVYQWLIEIVAFEKNILIAKQAYDAINLLWKSLPHETPPLYEELVDNRSVNYNRYMSVTTLTHILTSYGAIKLPDIEVITSSPSSSSSSQSQKGMNIDQNDKKDRLPLKQFEWVLALLTKSLILWPNAYTNQQIQYIATCIMYIGLDQICILLRNRIQDTIDACLIAFSRKKDCHWRLNAQQLAYKLCNEFNSVQQQLQLIKSVKSISSKSLYLRRVIAMIALEMALIDDSPPSSPKQQSVTTRMTFDILAESISSESIILLRINEMLSDKQSIFQQSDPDYFQLALRINLMDYAVGSNKDEFNDSVVSLKWEKRKKG